MAWHKGGVLWEVTLQQCLRLAGKVSSLIQSDLTISLPNKCLSTFKLLMNDIYVCICKCMNLRGYLVISNAYFKCMKVMICYNVCY
jgi:hypothetical protein